MLFNQQRTFYHENLLFLKNYFQIMFYENLFLINHYSLEISFYLANYQQNLMIISNCTCSIHQNYFQVISNQNYFYSISFNFYLSYYYYCFLIYLNINQNYLNYLYSNHLNFFYCSMIFHILFSYEKSFLSIIILFFILVIDDEVITFKFVVNNKNEMMNVFINRHCCYS